MLHFYGIFSLDGPRPTQEEIQKLRGYMLQYVKALVLRGPGVQDDELQSMLNYMTTMHEVCQHFIIIITCNYKSV